MAKKKSSAVVSQVEPQAAPEVQGPGSDKPKDRTAVSLDRYLSRRGIPTSRRKAMEMYTTTRFAPMEDWDRIFSTY